MSELLWTNDLPSKEGYYWCADGMKTIMVKVEKNKKTGGLSFSGKGLIELYIDQFLWSERIETPSQGNSPIFSGKVPKEKYEQLGLSNAKKLKKMCTDGCQSCLLPINVACPFEGHPLDEGPITEKDWAAIIREEKAEYSNEFIRGLQ